MSEISNFLSDIGITKVIWIDDQFGEPNQDILKRQLINFVKVSLENDITLTNSLFGKLIDFPIEIRDKKIEEAVSENETNIVSILSSVKEDIKRQNSSLLKPEELSDNQFTALSDGLNGQLHKYSFIQWEQQKEDILSETQEKTLFLIDREATNEGLGPQKGDDVISLLSQNDNAKQATCLLLTHTVTPLNADSLRQAIASPTSGIPQYYFSVMSKTSIGTEHQNAVNEFKRALRAVLAGRICRELIDTSIEPMKKSLDTLVAEISGLAVDDIDTAIFKSASREGCMEIEIIERIIRISQHSALLSSFSTNTSLQDKIRKLSAISSHNEEKNINAPSTTPSMDKFRKWRRDEVLIDGEIINKLHYQLTCGDIFQNTTTKKCYVLIAQPCDLMVRNNGSRKQKEAVVAEIVYSEPSNLSSCFIKIEGAKEDGTDWFIDFRNTAFVNLKILDYAVFSDDGSVALKTTSSQSNISSGVAKLLTKAKNKLNSNKDLVLSINLPKGTQKVDSKEVNFPYKRIGRINQPWAHAILAAFATYHTRMALDHNFAKNT